jgi:hypothetical protein
MGDVVSLRSCRRSLEQLVVVWELRKSTQDPKDSLLCFPSPGTEELSGVEGRLHIV